MATTIFADKVLSVVIRGVIVRSSLKNKIASTPSGYIVRRYLFYQKENHDLFD
jgi:hypothetical protein